MRAPVTALALVIAAIVVPSARAQDLVPDPAYVADGAVNSIARDGTKLYLGGTFTQLSPRTGSVIAVDLLTGERRPAYPEVDGPIDAFEGDGSGGQFIAGRFETVGGVPARGMAHVNSDGTVDATFVSPLAAGERILSIYRSGATLFVGGRFDALAGQQRRNLGALTLGGAPTAWDPGVIGGPSVPSVNRVLERDGKVYALGVFTCVGAVTDDFDCTDLGEAPRRMVARFDAVTGAADAGWDPDPNRSVEVINFISGDVLLGGRFECLKDTGSVVCDAGLDVRRGVARVDPTTGDALPWVANVGDSNSFSVEAFAVDGNDLYIGGNFTCANWSGDNDCNDPGELPRTDIARVAIDTQAFSSFAVAVPGGSGVESMLLNAEKELYVAGSFREIGGVERRALAVLDGATGLVRDTDHRLNGSATTFGLGTAGLLVGGEFTGAGGVDRAGLAAIDLLTHTPTTFDPSPNGDVRALLVHNGRLYAGGSFGEIGGAVRTSLAAWDLGAGDPTLAGWAPPAAAAVNALAVSGSTIFAGGGNLQLDGASALAALDAASGAPLPDAVPLVERSRCARSASVTGSSTSAGAW